MPHVQLPIADRGLNGGNGLAGGRTLDAETMAFVRWMLVWLGLANAGFMLMWFVGAPPRGTAILAIGVVGLLVRGRAYWIQAMGFVATLAFSIISFISGLFNLNLTSLIYAIGFLNELNPSSSVEYVVVAAGMLTTLWLALTALRRPTDFKRPVLVAAAFASVCVLSAVDSWMGRDMRGHYGRVAVAGAMFESASEKSGFQGLADGRHHMLMVVVESLGQPLDNAEMARKLFAFYKSPEVRARYDITTGTSLYYNSTTAGEMRELCGRWGDYFEVLDTPDSGCLPARLARRGYGTEAIHDFSGFMFERETWYPHIGFQKQSFARDLTEQGVRVCGGVFPGACDRDVPRLIGEKLKSANRPQFLYWLTVNSHLPVPNGLNLNVDHCERVSPQLARDFPMICRQFAIFDQVDRALVSEITADDFPATDILIVGDHMPPYFDRYNRTQFAPDRVPWIMLKAKRRPPSDVTAGAGATASQQG